MKQVTQLDEAIIEVQGKLFEYMALYGYHMDVFTEQYMNSDFVKRYYETGYSYLQGNDLFENLDFLLPEIQDNLTQYPNAVKLIPSVPGNGPSSNLGLVEPTSEMIFDIDVAEWIGETYRRLNIMTSIPSKELIQLFPFNLMCKMYPGLHTIDATQSIEILMESVNKSP